MPLKITVKAGGPGTWKVKLDGRLDSLTAPDCEARLKALKGARAIVLDLSALDYISSLGLRTILAARQALEKKQGQLLLANMQAPVAKVFEIAKIMPETFIFDSVASADIYLDAVQRRERLAHEDLSE